MQEPGGLQFMESQRVGHNLATKWYTSKTIKLLYSYNKYQTELNQMKTQKIHSECMLKMVFSVVMYGCKSWTTKKAECKRIDGFKLWCWRRLLRDSWTAKRSNQSILKEINPEYSMEGLTLKLKLQYFGHLMQRAKLIGKDPDAGKDWGQEKKGVTEDELVGWHHWLNGYEFE